MSIFYDKYSLLNLFCDEPVFIDKEAKILTYTYEDNFGFKFILHFSTFEEYVSITLSYNNMTNPIFDILLSNVEKIDADNEKLIIYVRDNDKKISVYLKPNISLSFDENVI
ncbi:hypothetical protein [Clostridium aciditolerans]|uniref:Uncharacterized protein n=1 Tax=Clostridium aciditolerans TaxID=339861 RepID=A0A934HTU9_9CLOT|nr:hypothetical protein [Clostridium aciditolerans]MBI6871804.1 hypothetical protein [Clostridium aciditolerans]